MAMRSSGAVTTAQLLKQRSRYIVSNKAYASDNGDDVPENKVSTEDLGCNPAHGRVSGYFRNLRDTGSFQAFVITVILIAGVLVGINTYSPSGDFQVVVLSLDEMVVGIFVAEIVIKLAAEGRRPWMYFADAWNLFDFTIVAVGFFKFSGGAVTALRLIRLLRVLKLVRALPKLRVLVIGLMKSMASIAYIGALLLLIFFLYGVLGVTLFGTNDPVHFGNLHLAMLTLFRCSTLEDWTDVLYISMYGCDEYGYGGMEQLCVAPSSKLLLAVVYFISFIVISAMTVLNLFIGVIMNQLQDAKMNVSGEDADRKAQAESGVPKQATVLQRLDALETLMGDIKTELNHFVSRKEAELAEKRSLHAQMTKARAGKPTASSLGVKMAPGTKDLLSDAMKRAEAIRTESTKWE